MPQTFCLVTYRKSGSIYFAKATKNPREYVILENMTPGILVHKNIKPGNLIVQGTKDNIKTFEFIDTEEKLGDFLLRHKL